MDQATGRLFRVLQLRRHPVEALVQTLAIGGTGGLNVPVTVAQGVECEALGNLSTVESMGKILFKDVHNVGIELKSAAVGFGRDVEVAHSPAAHCPRRKAEQFLPIQRRVAYLLVSKDKQHCVTELILGKHTCQLLAGLGKTLSVVAVDDKNETYAANQENSVR